MPCGMGGTGLGKKRSRRFSTLFSISILTRPSPRGEEKRKKISTNGRGKLDLKASPDE